MQYTHLLLPSKHKSRECKCDNPIQFHLSNLFYLLLFSMEENNKNNNWIKILNILT